MKYFPNRWPQRCSKRSQANNFCPADGHKSFINKDKKLSLVQADGHKAVINKANELFFPTDGHKAVINEAKEIAFSRRWSQGCYEQSQGNGLVHKSWQCCLKSQEKEEVSNYIHLVTNAIIIKLERTPYSHKIVIWLP